MKIYKENKYENHLGKTTCKDIIVYKTGGTDMINSNLRKRALAEWLKTNDPTSYESSLKLQKFLFFYECFSKMSSDNPDFSHLQGWKKGPVFSNVWGDYTKERDEFDQNISDVDIQKVNVERAKRADFIVKVASETELTELTHLFDIWKAKKDKINKGNIGVTLSETDFSEHDMELSHFLFNMFSDEVINNSHVIRIDNYYFVFHKSDEDKIGEVQYDTLCEIAKHPLEDMANPIFAEIDEEGAVVIND